MRILIAGEVKFEIRNARESVTASRNSIAQVEAVKSMGRLFSVIVKVIGSYVSPR